jgi:hypothetical protein
MNRSEYETAICKQLPCAKLVPLRPVPLGAPNPVIAKCHENVNAWVQATPEHSPVRGWVCYRECVVGVTLGIELTAHSVVRDQNGDLFDITPLADERPRLSGFMRFVPHVGPDALFWEIEKTNRFICCVGCTAP